MEMPHRTSGAIVLLAKMKKAPPAEQGRFSWQLVADAVTSDD